MRNERVVPSVSREIVQFIQQQVLRRIDQVANLAQPVLAPWEIGGLHGDNAGIGRCNDLDLRHRWYLKLQGRFLCLSQKAYDSLYIEFASGAPFT
jgi:hypothetical protein